MNTKSKIALAVVAAAALTAVAMLLPLPGRDAAAQSTDVYIVAVDLDIVPSETTKFLEAMKENGELAIKEGGCREFNITVLASDPNHVFLYEVYADFRLLEVPLRRDQLPIAANIIAKHGFSPVPSTASPTTGWLGAFVNLVTPVTTESAPILQAPFAASGWDRERPDAGAPPIYDNSIRSIVPSINSFSLASSTFGISNMSKSTSAHLVMPRENSMNLTIGK
jgi:quinol monooxygenase YgiN